MADAPHASAVRPKEELVKIPILQSLAFAAIAVAALGTANPAAAATHASPAWALLRVDVSPQGDVEGVRLRYASGNRSFDRTALEAASRTVFAPKFHLKGPTAFDYLLLRDAQGRHTRIVPVLSGYQGSAHSLVRVVSAA